MWTPLRCRFWNLDLCIDPHFSLGTIGPYSEISRLQKLLNGDIPASIPVFRLKDDDRQNMRHTCNDGSSDHVSM